MEIKKLFKPILFIIYLLIGIYVLNLSEEYIIVPEMIYSFNSLILFIAGILLIIGGINYLRVSK